MKKNNSKGFTLVELIVVIAIIGILAAILIPSLTEYIKKANYSNDTQDAANMTKIVSLYCAENNLKVEKLTPNEVKTIILTSGQFNLRPRNNDWTFVWNINESKVEAMYFNEAAEVINVSSNALTNVNNSLVLLSTSDISFPEEVLKSGYYLIGKGKTSIEETVNKIRNFNVDVDNFDEIITNLRGDKKFGSFADQFESLFHPDITLFINENGANTSATPDEYGYKTVKKVIFGDSISFIPSFGDKLILPNQVKVPATIEYISEGAFSGVSSETKLLFSGNPIFEEDFKYNSSMLRANGNIQPVTTRIDYATKGISLIDVEIDGTIYTSGSFVNMSYESILLAIKDFKTNNNISKLSNAEFRFGYSDDIKFDNNGLAYPCKFVVKLYSYGKLVGYSSVYYREINVIEK